MNENPAASSKLLVELLSSDGLNEAIAILIVIAIAVIAGRLAKAVLGRVGNDVRQRPWTGRLIETAAILTPYLVAALLIGLAENAARQFGMAYNVLALSSQLVIALGVNRRRLARIRIDDLPSECSLVTTLYANDETSIRPGDRREVGESSNIPRDGHVCSVECGDDRADDGIARASFRISNCTWK